MARLSISNLVVAQSSIFLFLTILATTASSSSLVSERSDTCPSSSVTCSNPGLAEDFCCPSSTTCLSIDSGSSVICCPEGHDCTYIQPITCDVSQQNPSLYPNNVVKTSRLNDKLPTCGDQCCPFGYTCDNGNSCAKDGAPPLHTSTSTSTSARSSTTEETTSTDTSTSKSASTSSTFTTSALEPTITTTDTPGSVLDTSVTSPSETLTPTASTTYIQSSPASESGQVAAAASATCPDLPIKAIVAGFFPGVILGAVSAALGMMCARRRQRRNPPPAVKVFQNTHRTTSGTLIGISDPIPSDESSFRTDFLRTNLKRNSEGARSVLQRSKSRVKSLFGGVPKPNPASMEPVPPLPFTPPRQRQLSTESIRVYTPPGTFATTAVLKPDPYPSYRPNTTMGDIIEQAAASRSNTPSNNNTTNGSNQRFLLAPVPKSAIRKPRPV